MHLSVKSSENPFKTGPSRKTALWFSGTVRVRTARPGRSSGPEGLSSYRRPAPLRPRLEGVPRAEAQLHLCRSMFRAYSIRRRSSSEQPAISRAVSRKVADSLSSLM